MILTRLLILLCALWVGPALADIREPKTTMITGGGGLPIALTQWGNSEGRSILFIHGFLSSTLNWHKQIASDLGKTYNLAAIDLRGHGASAKPASAENYIGTQVWADDIAAAISAAGFTRPLIVAASFGGLFTMDYIRAHGVGNIAGIVVAGGTAGLIAPPPPAERTPERQAQIDRNTSPNLETIIDWTNGYLKFLFADGPLPPHEAEMLKLSSLLTPHYVRPYMREHRNDNTDIVNKLALPMLFIVGTKDAATKLPDVRAASKAVKGSVVTEYEGLGSLTYWYAAERFNRDIAAFAEETRAGNKQ